MILLTEEKLLSKIKLILKCFFLVKDATTEQPKEEGEDTAL